MKNKKEWETKSLEWIHKAREEIDNEIKRKGMTPAENKNSLVPGLKIRQKFLLKWASKGSGFRPWRNWVEKVIPKEDGVSYHCNHNVVQCQGLPPE